MKSVANRFWSKVNKIPGGCWEWKAAKSPSGYGHFAGFRSKNTVRAHRWAYTRALGPIPDGLVLDHTCRNRACVNPRHMEVVSIGENVMRGNNTAAFLRRQNYCKRGHALTDDNVYRSPSRPTQRRCRECESRRNIERHARERALRGAL